MNGLLGTRRNLLPPIPRRSAGSVQVNDFEVSLGLKKLLTIEKSRNDHFRSRAEPMKRGRPDSSRLDLLSGYQASMSLEMAACERDHGATDVSDVVDGTDPKASVDARDNDLVPVKVKDDIQSATEGPYAGRASAFQRLMSRLCCCMTQRMERNRMRAADREKTAQARDRAKGAVRQFHMLLELDRREGVSDDWRIADALLKSVRNYIYQRDVKSVGAERRVPPGEMPRLETLFKESMTTRGHSCRDLILAGVALLRESGIAGVEVRQLGFDDHGHAVLLIGKGPFDTSRGIGRLPSSAGICDIWANIACSPQEYVNRMTHKLKHWSTEERRVLDLETDRLFCPGAAGVKEKLKGKLSLSDL